MNILFAGDIMPGGVLPYRKGFITDNLKKYLNGFDLRVGTLECAVGDNIPFDTVKMSGKKNIIHCRVADIDRVTEMGFDVLSLSNNHVFDLGAAGLENTIEVLEKRGLKFCGAGRNIEEASRPAVINFGGKSIAFLAYCQYNSVYIGHLQIATETEPGVNPLDIERCEQDIRTAKQRYDYVFVLPHWGNEYQYLPTPICVEWGKRMIDAGADGVFASHTHQVQPMVVYNGHPLAFSMANFLFPDFYMQPPRPIWYPEEGFDDSSLERIVAYPKSIDKPCVQKWRHLSRIGMAVDCSIDDKRINASYKLVYTGHDDILGLYVSPAKMRARMKWMGAMIMAPHYTTSYNIYHSRWNVPRRAFHLMCRLLSEK